MSSNLPKKQRNFFKDFCHSLKKEVESTKQSHFSTTKLAFIEDPFLVIFAYPDVIPKKLYAVVSNLQYPSDNNVDLSSCISSYFNPFSTALRVSSSFQQKQS